MTDSDFIADYMPFARAIAARGNRLTFSEAV